MGQTGVGVVGIPSFVRTGRAHARFRMLWRVVRNSLSVTSVVLHDGGYNGVIFYYSL